MIDRTSALERERRSYRPRGPAILGAAEPRVRVSESGPTRAVADEGEIRARFPRTYGRPLLELDAGGEPPERRPLRVGVVLSGGQAPGGHNVITGLFDGLRALHDDAALSGFLGGPRGLLERRERPLDAATLAPYRNTGGFDVIGSGRDKIEGAEQLAAAHATCRELGLDGLVVVGGDDSNTNAAVLAEYLLEQGCATCVVGVPKTIDGDLKGPNVEASFGFDTATRVYSELVGNICRDALSAGKYWHFVRLMGRSTSHVTLECALQTHPNVALIAEEVEQRGWTLDRVAESIAEVVARRAASGLAHGVCLVPEGLIEFVPEMRRLIARLNDLLAARRAEFDALAGDDARRRFVEDSLPPAERETFGRLPAEIRHELLLERDSHGNVQVSKIDTERLLISRVQDTLDAWRASGRFAGRFAVQEHFFGYEGRCAAPTNFDADYGWSLGRLAALLIALRRTGYLCSLRGLAAPAGDWRATAVPLTSMMHLETRKGRRVAVIAKSPVRTDSEPFLSFAAARDGWARADDYRYPGAIQYFGPPAVSAAPSLTLQLEAARGAR